MLIVRVVALITLITMCAADLSASKRSKARETYQNCINVISEAKEFYQAERLNYPDYLKVVDLQQRTESLLALQRWQEANDSASECTQKAKILIEDLIKGSCPYLLRRLGDLNERKQECSERLDKNRFPQDAGAERMLEEFVVTRFAPLVHKIAGHPAFHCASSEISTSAPASYLPNYRPYFPLNLMIDNQVPFELPEANSPPSGPIMEHFDSVQTLLPAEASLLARLAEEYACIISPNQCSTSLEDASGPMFIHSYGDWDNEIEMQLRTIDEFCRVEDVCEDKLRHAAHAGGMGRTDEALATYCEIFSLNCRRADTSRQASDEIERYAVEAEHDLSLFKERYLECKDFDLESRKLTAFLKGIEACKHDKYLEWNQKFAEAKQSIPNCRCPKEAIDRAMKELASSAPLCDHAAALAEWKRVAGLLENCGPEEQKDTQKEWDIMRMTLAACDGEKLMAKISKLLQANRMQDAENLISHFAPPPSSQKRWDELRAEFRKTQQRERAIEELQSSLLRKDALKTSALAASLPPSRLAQLWESLCSTGQIEAATQLALNSSSQGTPSALPMKCPGSDPTVAKPLSTVGSAGFLSMDIWQSAWNDFSDLPELFDYIRKSGIRSVNLNPGLPMGPRFFEESYGQFAPLAKQFQEAGIHIAFLYAELGYPIGYYAQFLKDHLDEFGIDTILDDSEFVDAFSDSFARNLTAVHQHGIRYSAFVTLESIGNSGVSDNTRHWVLENVDEPILMSYFSCDLDEQKRWVEPYLLYADHLGKHRNVKIAILMGAKSIGREISCERLMKADEFLSYVRALHAWGLNHPSYGGIVIETNQRFPRYPVGPLTP